MLCQCCKSSNITHAVIDIDKESPINVMNSASLKSCGFIFECFQMCNCCNGKLIRVVQFYFSSTDPADHEVCWAHAVDTVVTYCLELIWGPASSSARRLKARQHSGNRRRCRNTRGARHRRGSSRPRDQNFAFEGVTHTADFSGSDQASNQSWAMDTSPYELWVAPSA